MNRNNERAGLATDVIVRLLNTDVDGLVTLIEELRAEHKADLDELKKEQADSRLWVQRTLIGLLVSIVVVVIGTAITLSVKGQ